MASANGGGSSASVTIDSASPSDRHAQRKLQDAQPVAISASESPFHVAFPICKNNNSFHQRNIHNSHSTRVRNCTRKPCPPDIPQQASLFTIFENAPVLVFPSLMTYKPDAQPAQHVEHLAHASSFHISFPIHRNPNDLSQCSNNSPSLHIHNHTRLPCPPALPKPASLFTIFENAPVLFVPSMMTLKIPPSIEKSHIKTKQETKHIRSHHVLLPVPTIHSPLQSIINTQTSLIHHQTTLLALLEQQHVTTMKLLQDNFDFNRLMIEQHLAFHKTMMTMLLSSFLDATPMHPHHLSPFHAPPPKSSDCSDSDSPQRSLVSPSASKLVPSRSMSSLNHIPTLLPPLQSNATTITSCDTIPPLLPSSAPTFLASLSPASLQPTSLSIPGLFPLAFLLWFPFLSLLPPLPLSMLFSTLFSRSLPRQSFLYNFFPDHPG